MLPIATDIAVRATRAQAHSALPDAPVLTDETVALSARAQRRVKLAGVLRRIADRVEPVSARPHGVGT